MIPHIDADVLRYEIGFSGEGEDGPLSFDYVADLLDTKVSQICHAVKATAPAVMYLTTGKNFRDEIASTKPYKGNRKKEKPFHFQNLTAYIKNAYKYKEAIGVEADDLLSLDQTDETVICSRDKDLLMVPGWQYGWECGKQKERHLHYVTPEGKLWMDGDKLRGEGLSFFYAQLLMGDSVDNIPGCPGVGPKKTFGLLGELPPSYMWPVVQSTYHHKGLDDEYILEQGRLLWMTREMNEEGPVLWQLPS